MKTYEKKDLTGLLLESLEGSSPATITFAGQETALYQRRSVQLLEGAFVFASLGLSTEEDSAFVLF